MPVRNLLLIVGVLAILAGASIAGYMWLHPGSRPAAVRTASQGRAAVLVAAGPIAAGGLVQENDLAWRDTGAGPVPAGALVRGQVSTAQYVGSVARRGLAAGELITANALIGPQDRRFLSAVLTPGHRAVTLPIEAAQSASGLVRPDDRVDVILVQDLDAGQVAPNPARAAAQTILSDVRVLALDRDFSRAAPTAAAARPGGSPAVSAPTPPRTITLEVTERDAERLLVARQIGKVEISLRALAGSAQDAAGPSGPVWGSDVSATRVAAVRAAAPPRAPAARRSGAAPAAPAIRIIRGSKAAASQ
jgi:pilus assembly protein CpaB